MADSASPALTDRGSTPASQPPVNSASARETRGRQVVERVGPYGVLIVLALSVVIFSILRPDSFATVGNAKSILTVQSVLAVAALGVTIPLICGQFDLSVSANVSLSGLITAGLMSRTGLGWELAALAGLLVGVLIGLINGVLVAYGGVHSFIATLATGTFLSGVVLWYSGGQIIYNGISPQFVDLMQGSLIGIPLPVFYTAIAVMLVWFVLSHTPFGRHLYAIGGNRSAAEIAGVRVKRQIMYSLISSGALVGLAGVMLTSRAESAQTGAGDTYLLPAFAAAFIGAATLRRGEFNAVGTVIGVYFVAILVSGAFVLGADNYVSSMITGVALILAVLGNRALADKH